MNDLQIDYFLAVAQNLNFTKTAEQLYVTQSTISKQIGNFEKELGLILFDRTGKQIQLTDAGKIIYKFFRDYKSNLKSAITEAAIANQSKNGSVCIGYLESQFLHPDINAILTKFMHDFPNVSLTVECMELNELLTSLQNDRLDLILTIDNILENLKKTDWLLKYPFTALSRTMLFSKNHPLAQKKELSITDFQDEVFFTFEGQEQNIRELLSTLFGKPAQTKVVNRIESAFACVEAGLGVAIGNSWSVALDHPLIQALPLPQTQTIVIARKKEHENTAADVLLNELLASVNK